MIKKIKNKLVTLLAGALVLVPMLAPVAVNAQANIETGLCKGAELNVNSDGTACASDVDAGNTVNEIITTVINIFSIVVGVIAVIMIIIGGIKYITSGGDSNNISSAKTTIIYAIIGLVVVALVQVVVKFVLSRVGQATT